MIKKKSVTVKPKNIRDITKISEEEFNALPRRQQRVVIAKDAILQLSSRRYTEKHGVYFRTNSASYFSLENGSAKKFLTSKAKENKCYVCAKGAAACSLIRLKNKATMEQVSDIAFDGSMSLKTIFGNNLWHEMEAMFENLKISIKDIMQNLIDNGGRLKTLGGKMLG